MTAHIESAKDALDERLLEPFVCPGGDAPRADPVSHADRAMRHRYH